jgi:7-cyano-7-deazaguanine synthase
LEAESRALVVFSGGQDSTTCLFWALSKFKSVSTISFDYGQKHLTELDSAQKICALAGVDYDLIKIPNILRSSSPLTDHDANLDLYEDIDQIKPGLQNTFVPGRNILFLTIAGNVALAKNCAHIVIGVCQEDYGGYYDCRQDFINAMEAALNLGLLGRAPKSPNAPESQGAPKSPNAPELQGAPKSPNAPESQGAPKSPNAPESQGAPEKSPRGLSIHTPLMDLNKAGAVKLATNLPEPYNQLCMEALGLSHTCYAGKRPPCGQCNACLLRARGFRDAGVKDPLDISS